MKKIISHSTFIFFLAIVFYTFVFVVYTFPLVTVFTTHVSGFEGSDSAQYLWNIFIFRHNLTNSQPLFYTDYICYPLGANLFLHTYTPLVNVFALLFKNPYLAVNIMTYLQFVLSGLGAYMLCKKLTQHITWSLFAGFIFAFGSYKMAHYSEHLNLILTATIPFYILCFINTIHFSATNHLPVLHSIRSLLLSIVLLALTFFSDYYLTFYILLFSGLYVCFPFIQNWFYSLSIKTRWIGLIVFFLLSHTVVNQLMLFHVNCNSAFWWQPDFFSFFIPSFFSYFFDTKSYYILNSGPGASTEVVIFMGWIFSLLVFSSIFLFFQYRKKAPIAPQVPFEFYAFASVLFVMMSIPEFKLLDEGYFYLPTGLFHFIPIANHLRIPGRCVLMVSLFLPLVVAFLWVHYKAILPKIVYTALPLLCLMVSFFEFLPKSYEMINRSSQQTVNEWLEQKPGTVMMTLPLFAMDGMKILGTRQKEQLMDQTVHHKKILSGYVSRLKEEVFTMYESDSLCRCIFYLQMHPKETLPALDKKYTALFLQHFKTDLIHIPSTYQKSNLHSFIKDSFEPYIIFKDSLNGDMVYGIHHL